MIQSVDIPWSQGMDFGMGINLLDGAVAGKATVPGPVTTTTHAGGQTVSYQLRKVTSLEEVYSSIGISVEASGHYGLFGAAGKVRYANEVKFNSQSTFLLARCFVENAFEQCQETSLTEAASHLLAQGGDALFQERFGDGFVRGMQNGGEFHAIIAITSVSKEQQESVGADLMAKYGGLFAGAEIDTSLDTATKQKVQRTDVMISTFQRGGQGDESSFTSDVEMVMARLKAFPRFVRENPVPFGVQVASYRTLALPDGPSPIDIQAQKDSLAEYARIQLKLQSLKNDVEFMQLHPTCYVNPPTMAVLNGWQESFATQLDRLKATASACARNPVGGCGSFSLQLPNDFISPERTPGIAGKWEMVFKPPGGESTWTLEPLRGNQYKATEEGLGNARGVAILNGKRVLIDWTASNPGDTTSGRFAWDLNDDFTSATATVEFFTVHTNLGVLSGRFIRLP